MSVHEPSLEAIGFFERDLVVQAGAGTGKTHALVTLYLHLVSGLGARSEALPPARVLVITFTDKAGAELRERIRARLGTLLDEGLANEPVLAASAARRGRSLPPREVLRRALEGLTRAPIGTFHSFGHAMLRRHALAAGIDPGFQLVDDGEARSRATDAARAAILDALAAGDAHAERLVQDYGFAPSMRGGMVAAVSKLRAARAGEGRSAIGIAASYAPARLEEQRVDALVVLRRALARFGELDELVGDKSKPKARALAAVATAPELDEPDADTLLVSLRGELSNLRGTKPGTEVVGEAREAGKAAVEAFAEALASLVAAPLAVCMERLVDACEAHYTAWKRSASVVDFDDLLVLPRNLLRDRPEVAQQEAARYAALLVDEFQDTNRVQAELVERLAVTESDVAAGRRFVVGDRKQSIYEFRGADVAVFSETTRAMRYAGAGEVLLQRSFRSVPRVVALCNALFARAFGAGPPTSGWALAFDPLRDALQAAREDVPHGAAELIRVAVAPDAENTAAARRRLEARAIAARMRALMAAGHGPGQLALLLRAYTHLDTYLEALRREEIPHYVVRGRGFYEAQEIRDLASLIALLHYPEDRFALVSVLRSPLCGLSDDGLAALAVTDEVGPAALRKPIAALRDEDRRALEGLAPRLRGLYLVMDRLGPARLLAEILDVFDLRAIWAATEAGTQKIANLEHLLARVETLAADPSGPVADLPSFARWLARAVRPLNPLESAGAQIVDERDDVVRVMSVHQAKGLQFPIVFIADCGAKAKSDGASFSYDPGLGIGVKVPGEKPGKLVHSAPSRQITELQKLRQHAESLRLFYVAATRARDIVVFSGEPVDKGGGWRGYLDALLADPSTNGLLTVIDQPAVPSDRVASPIVAHELELELDTLPGLVPLRLPAARGVRVAVTQLKDFALCARRYHLFHELRLEEHPQKSDVRDEGDVRHERDPELEPEPADDLDEPRRVDPLRAGTLAHRLLERSRFGASLEESRAELHAHLIEEGYDPADPATADIQGHVLRFLASDFARSVGPRLRRELPFALALPAGPVARTRILRGQIDLLAFSDEGIDIVDYKHATRGDLEAYRFQLEAYALAAAALYPRAPRVRVGLAFLGDEDPAPIWVELAPLVEIEARIGKAFDALALARLDSTRPGVAIDVCERVRCGYLAWCHGTEAQGQ